jgi:hypothetical protein
MPDVTSRTSMPKLYVLVVGSIVILLSYFVSRLSMEQHFAAVDNARAPSAPTWDTGSMWTSHSLIPASVSPFEFRPDAVTRSAQLRESTSTFENDIASLRKTVAAHHGYFENLRTQTQSGYPRRNSRPLSPI